MKITASINDFLSPPQLIFRLWDHKGYYVGECSVSAEEQTAEAIVDEIERLNAVDEAAKNAKKMQ